MNSLIVYYSRYGNTAYVAEKFAEALTKIGKIELVQLEYSQKQNIFFRTLYRFIPHLAKLNPAITDIAPFDVLCLGIPVWGGRPSAPITRYLHLCKNLNGKKIICYYIFGFLPSATKCSQFVGNILLKNSPALVTHVFIPWANISNDDFLDNTVKGAIEKISGK